MNELQRKEWLRVAPWLAKAEKELGFTLLDVTGAESSAYPTLTVKAWEPQPSPYYEDAYGFHDNGCREVRTALVYQTPDDTYAQPIRPGEMLVTVALDEDACEESEPIAFVRRSCSRKIDLLEIAVLMITPEALAEAREADSPKAETEKTALPLMERTLALLEGRSEGDEDAE